MELIKVIQLDDLKSYRSLLNEAFTGNKSEYFDDFPIWNPSFALNKVHKIGHYLGNRLISCAGIRIGELKVNEPNGQLIYLKVGIIGAVATCPDYRGFGYATHLVQQLLDWAKAQQVSWVFLWSSENTFYQKLGFNYIGQQMRVSLDALPLGESFLSEKIQYGWNPNLFPLVQKRSGGLLLRQEDQVWFEQHRNVEWYFINSAEWPEKPTAYLGLGRGIDLGGLIHEWGGDPIDVWELIRHVRKYRPGLSIMGSPEVFVQLGISGVGLQESLCLGKKIQKPVFFSDPDLKTPISDLSRKENDHFPFWIWGLDGA